MSKIIEIHDKVFDFLYKRYEKEKTNNNKFYFTTRKKKSDRLENGYWFQGNDDYLVISFWTGMDTLNKTSNVYFEIRMNGLIRVVFVAKDSDYKKQYFKKMADWVYFKEYDEDPSGLFLKTITKNHNDNYINYLENFINNDKIKIDEYIKSTIFESSDEDEVIEDEFASKFGFIPESQFDKMTSQILQIKARKERVKKIENILDPDTGQDSLQLDKESQTSLLPYYIQGFEIENYQGIKSTKVNGLNGNAKWIFITGENGFGKTSILQAICNGLSNNSDVEKYNKPQTKVFVEFIAGNEFHRNNAQEKFDKEQFYSLKDNLIAYGPSRLEIQAFNQRLDETQSSSNTYNLFNTNGFLKNIEYSLIHLYKWNPKRYQIITESILKVLGGRLGKIEIDETGEKVLYFESSENGEHFDPVTFDQLAVGFRSIIAFIGDMIIRFSEKDPDINMNDISGIVMIDEIENHLHPKLQKEFVTLLSETFPKIQFIASTHSPVPLLGAPSNTVFLKVDRTVEGGISVVSLDIDISDLLPNSIFSSPIFDFDEYIPASHNNQQKLRTEKIYDDAWFYKVLEQKIKDKSLRK